MPKGMGLSVSAIFGSTGFQSELHLGALSLLFIEWFLTWIAACSVRSIEGESVEEAHVTDGLEF